MTEESLPARDRDEVAKAIAEASNTPRARLFPQMILLALARQNRSEHALWKSQSSGCRSKR